MNYPVVIHKDKKSDYGLTVPDLPGCFSAGKTFDEALENSKEASFFMSKACLKMETRCQRPEQLNTIVATHNLREEFGPLFR